MRCRQCPFFNTACGACTVHANSASDALDALVNAALMAGENVTEPVVRNVFSSELDIVGHPASAHTPIWLEAGNEKLS